MFKQIVPVLPNIPLLKAADKNSYHTFPFFYYGYLVQVKKKYQQNTGTVACDLCFNFPETYL